MGDSRESNIPKNIIALALGEGSNELVEVVRIFCGKFSWIGFICFKEWEPL